MNCPTKVEATKISLVDSTLDSLLIFEGNTVSKYDCYKYSFFGGGWGSDSMACRESMASTSKLLATFSNHAMGFFYGEFTHKGIPRVIAALFEDEDPTIYSCEAVQNVTPGGFVYSGVIATISFDKLCRLLKDDMIALGVGVHCFILFSKFDISELPSINPLSSNSPLHLDSSIVAAIYVGNDCDHYDLLIRHEYSRFRAVPKADQNVEHPPSRSEEVEK